MPCSSGPSQEQIEKEERQKRAHQRDLKLRTQIACAALTYIEQTKQFDQFLNQIDYQEAGFVLKDLTNWWAQHKHEDEVRRKKEAKEREKKLEDERLAEVRKGVLGKLSADELKALGLKRI
jgi:uncharacterized NAD(P)/FAD-binding protein YdhS